MTGRVVSLDAAFSLLWAAPLVGLLGYASHRASLCTVRAVADVLNVGSFQRFAGFARAVFWTLALTVPAAWLFRGQFAAPVSGGPLWTGLLGGLLFGFGAALNKGCSFSTLQRLADGDWRMLAALAGFFGGSALCYLLPAAPHLQVERVSGPVSGAWPALATAVLWLWAAVELTRLWRRRVSWRGLVHAPDFSPAATGLLLGLGSGLLYLGFGPWTYTNSLQGGVGALVGERLAPPPVQLALVPALFAGMLVSAWQRGAWAGRRSIRGWPVNLVGGVLMGLGGVMIPGGNDTLLLRLIPSLAPDSLWSYFMLVVGVAMGLLLQRRRADTACKHAGC